MNKTVKECEDRILQLAWELTGHMEAKEYPPYDPDMNYSEPSQRPVNKCYLCENEGQWSPSSIGLRYFNKHTSTCPMEILHNEFEDLFEAQKIKRRSTLSHDPSPM